MIALLAACGLFAIYPSLVWMTAWSFDGIDDAWMDTIGLSAFTIPMAMALAAVVLTIHGLQRNRSYQEEAAEAFEELQEKQRELALVGAGETTEADPDAAEGASVSASHGSRMARTPASKRSKGDDAKRRAKSMARRKLRQTSRWF